MKATFSRNLQQRCIITLQVCEYYAETRDMHNETGDTSNLTMHRQITQIHDIGVYIFKRVADNVLRDNKHILFDLPEKCELVFFY